ncbi:MAG: hypothetical protein HYX75_11045 [Acidobacteria bacterium]|nr:hypothetical protein [Acidobacteriota bacterium]
MSGGAVLADALVGMAVTALFAMSAFSYFSATRDVAVRLGTTVFQTDSLRLAADSVAQDVRCAGSGIAFLDHDDFTPLQLGSPPNGKNWSESVTVYSNGDGATVTLAAPVEAGNPVLAATTETVGPGQRLLLRGEHGWEVARVEEVRKDGPVDLITLSSPPRSAYSQATAVTVTGYSYDRRLRRLYRSTNGGSRQPLLDECADFKIQIADRDTGEPLGGSLGIENLAGAVFRIEIATAGRSVQMQFQSLFEDIDSRFFEREGDEKN